MFKNGGGAVKDIWERETVTSEWRNMHNEELHAVYCSLNTVWVMKSGRVAQKGESTGVYRVLVGETWGKQTTWKS